MFIAIMETSRQAYEPGLDDGDTHSSDSLMAPAGPTSSVLVAAWAVAH
jgi:hypothetical protein